MTSIAETPRHTCVIACLSATVEFLVRWIWYAIPIEFGEECRNKREELLLEKFA